MSTISSSTSEFITEEPTGGEWLWIIGALCAAIGAISQNLGVNTQKYAFMKNEELPLSERVNSPIHMPLWLLGLCFVVLGACGDFVALGFAAQSVVAPIGSLTLVANIFFAHFWLGEDLLPKDIFGTACIVVGAIVAAVSGDHTEITYTVDELISYWGNLVFLAYIILVSFCMFVLYGILKYVEPIREEMMDVQEKYELAVQEKNNEGMIEQDSVLMVIEESYMKLEKYHSFSYCCLSGLFGGQNILFGKMVAELVGATFDGQNQLNNPLTYVFALCMGVTIIAQLHFLAKGLSLFDALYVVPIYRCFFIIISTLGGGLFFSEFYRFHLWQFFVFFPALVVAIIGVIILSQRKFKNKKIRNPYQFVSEDDDDEVSGEEGGRGSIIAPISKVNLLDMAADFDEMEGLDEDNGDTISELPSSTNANKNGKGRQYRAKSIFARNVALRTGNRKRPVRKQEADVLTNVLTDNKGSSSNPPSPRGSDAKVPNMLRTQTTPVTSTRPHSRRMNSMNNTMVNALTMISPTAGVAVNRRNKKNRNASILGVPSTLQAKIDKAKAKLIEEKNAAAGSVAKEPEVEVVVEDNKVDEKEVEEKFVKEESVKEEEVAANVDEVAVEMIEIASEEPAQEE